MAIAIEFSYRWSFYHSFAEASVLELVTVSSAIYMLEEFLSHRHIRHREIIVSIGGLIFIQIVGQMHVLTHDHLLN